MNLSTAPINQTTLFWCICPCILPQLVYVHSSKILGFNLRCCMVSGIVWLQIFWHFGFLWYSWKRTCNFEKIASLYFLSGLAFAYSWLQYVCLFFWFWPILVSRKLGLLCGSARRGGPWQSRFCSFIVWCQLCPGTNHVFIARRHLAMPPTAWKEVVIDGKAENWMSMLEPDRWKFIPKLCLATL